MEEAEAAPGVRIARSGLLEGYPWLLHGVTTRQGGVSPGPYASLNLGFHTGDEAARVVENRRRALVAVGAEPGSLTLGQQVHGAGVCLVGPGTAGAGGDRLDTALAGQDGLVTAEVGTTLAVLVADCVPVLLVDPEHRAVGVAHAGWRGAAGGVVEATVRALARHFGSRPAQLRAAIGPAIGPCCYQVGSEVVEAMQRQLGPGRSENEPLWWPEQGGTEGTFRLDLPGVVERLLRQAGLPAGSIDRSPWCTVCWPALFYSHRRDRGRTGRMAALAGVRRV